MEECCSMKGFLSFLVLRLINKKQMSGEDIREELRKRKGNKPSAGTIYPVLKILKKNGFIEEVGESGKEKKYKITKKGEKEVILATRKFVETFFDLKEDFSKCR
ncbi:MAG: PadR family transcriptional regulator [Nanoarchaeota archaeon]